MRLAAVRGVVLDVHPSNFAFVGGALAYLDDDVADGPRMPSIAHALLQRVREYSAFVGARDSYLIKLQSEMERRLTGPLVEAIDLLAILEAEPARTPDDREALSRILGAAQRVARGR